MADHPQPLELLIERLVRLPGVGRRSATRIAYYLARRPAPEVLALAEAIAALPEQLRPCTVCGNLAGGELCPICADPRRDRQVVCVVE